MKKGFHLSGLMALCFVLGSIVAKAAKPTIHTNPHDTTACTGGVVLFAITATDTPGALTITYQWQVSADGTTWTSLTDNATYAGSNTDSMLVTTGLSLNGNMYRAIATNTTGKDTSDPATLTVLTYPDAGTIAGNTAVCETSLLFLTDNVAGGTWSSSNTTIATVTAPGSIRGLAQGFATINYTTSNGYCTSTAIFPIRVDAIATAQPIVGANTVCKSSSITLSNANNTFGTGSWSASNASASVSPAGVVTGQSYGSVTITYDFTNACNVVSSTYTIQVDTVLNPGIISGPSSVCVGSTISLTETMPGGLWISGTTSVANISGSGNVSGVAQGTTIISYYQANGCGASIATHTVSVASPAGTIMGTDSVGIGGTRILANGTPGGIWSSDNAAIAAVNSTSGVVTGVAAGATTISYTVTNACGTTSDAIMFYVGGAPSAGTISGVDSVCVGATITLSDNVPGGVWSVSNALATVSASGVVTGVSRGRDTIYYTVSNGFGSTTVRKVIFVNSLPVITLTGPSVVGIGGNYFFNGSPAGGTFSHDNNAMGTFVAIVTSGGVTIGSYVVLGYGTDHIKYTVRNTCGTVDSFFTISLAPAGINTVNDETAALKVYPNPTQGDFTFNLSTMTTEDALVTITNVVGEKVKELTVSTNQDTNISLGQPAGIYFLTAVTAHGKYTTKITLTK